MLSDKEYNVEYLKKYFDYTDISQESKVANNKNSNNSINFTYIL